jgi:transcriptional regulator with XRE-family HTH domain
MRKAKKSEELLFKQIADSAQLLAKHQRGLSVGQLIVLIRAQLTISQRAVAKIAGIPQATLSKIESGRQQPTISSLKKILNALQCDLLITAVPRKSLGEIRRVQAEKKARKNIEYLKGTMSLERQTPSKMFLEELVEEEMRRLLDSSSSELWDE